MKKMKTFDPYFLAPFWGGIFVQKKIRELWNLDTTRQHKRYISCRDFCIIVITHFQRTLCESIVIRTVVVDQR